MVEQGTPVVEVVDLRKTYRRGQQETEVLHGINLTVQRGEFVCVMGPSGSGKSTLLQLIGSLDRPSAGRVSIDGVSLDTLGDSARSRFRRLRLGFVFQFFNLLPTLTALENVALPLLLEGASFDDVKGKALELLGLMHIGHRASHMPSQMSGGEMQRVAIARALIADPVLVLADEPTGNLDSQTGIGVLELLQEATRERHQTLILVTHDPRAATYATRLIRVEDGLIRTDKLSLRPRAAVSE